MSKTSAVTEATDSKENKDKDNEISLLDLLAVLFHYKKMIIVICVIAAVFAVSISIISIVMPKEKSFLPNKYTSSANLLIRDDSSSSSQLSALASSSLASLAGISGMGASSSNSNLALYLVTSNPLLDAITEQFGLIEKYEIKKHFKSESRKILKKYLKADYQEDSGVFTISFTDIEPEFAQEVVNFVLNWLTYRFDELGLDKNKIEAENYEKNIQSSYAEILRIEKEMAELGQKVNMGTNAWSIPSLTLENTKLQTELKAQEEVYAQLKTSYELLKIEMQSESPIFQVLEEAEVPDKKSGPSRAKLCIIIEFAAVFISIFLAFLLNAVKNIKNDPAAVNKFFPEKK